MRLRPAVFRQPAGTVFYCLAPSRPKAPP